ncbi:MULTISPECIES: hypothetical protein [unclassified Streptomyces]|uniref:hypothetical protein n=1 Tax=unclassified Streptomyces TaxID=2593676 RepID=UPI0033A33193
MNCTSGNPVIDLVKGFFSFLGDPIGTIVDLIAKTILAGAVAVFAALTTNVPTLEQTQTSKDISSDTQWIVVYLAVGSLLFAACRMAIERKGDAGRTALKGIMRVVLVSGAATTVVVAAAAVGDSYSNYLFNNAVRDSLNNVGACSDGSGIQSFLLLVLAFLLLIAGIIHTVLMYIRLGVMMLLLGTLPMAAAASMTDWGAGWWRKHIGWMIAWLLYKPAVALVLNAGMAMINSGRNSGSGDTSTINTRIAGIGVMLLSAIALPALLKLIVPATAAMGTGNPMSSMGQAGSSLASGAVQLGGSRGSSGGGGQMGPSGATGSGGSGGSSGAGGGSGVGGESGATGSGGANGAAAAGRAGASGAGAASGAAAAAGPAGVAVLAAVAAAQVASSTVTGAVEGADGELGHNK